ncbi:unnamed protein product [Orchesella dallaii]|uniref:Uncharacterized protein n=1 Tax=Orchesella dallaii TaxID=48710 RepID=A0ABP1RE86_9HEXA
MATEVANLTTPRNRSKSPILLKKSLEDKVKLSSKPLVDNEGNVLPYPTYKIQATKEKYCKPSPIARLAAAAAFSDKIPTAGGYAISRCKEPQVDFPSCCMMYEEDRPWVLGKMNPAALTDPEPEEIVVEAAAEESSEPTPPTPAVPKVEDVKTEVKVEDSKTEVKVEDSKAEVKVEDSKAEAKVEDAKAEAKVENAKSEPKVENVKSEPKVDCVKYEPKVEDVKSEPKVESTTAPKNAATKDVKKLSKSRNSSASPVRASRPLSGKSPRLQPQDKPKASKSPGRSGDPAAKLSPRTGAKKIVSAK